jgi:Pyridine nucleotide-disulphide oxidoreductase
MRIVIAGGGLAAQRCCAALRRLGHDGPITLVGEEPLLPYDRPPLSKDWLAGAIDEAALLLRPPSWYAEHAIDVRLRARATHLHVAAQRLRLADGQALRYDRLLIATGARARPLPATERYENVGVLRSAADAGRLRPRLRPGARLVVVGAGFIGLEAAATARALGADVTVLDAAGAPLEAIVGPRLGAWFAELHREEGVRLLLHRGIGGLRCGRRQRARRAAHRRHAHRLRRGARRHRRAPRHGLARGLAAGGPGRGRRRPRPHRRPRRLRRRRRSPRRALGGRGPSGRRRGARDARPQATRAGSGELLERPVRHPHPAARRAARSDRAEHRRRPVEP